MAVTKQEMVDQLVAQVVAADKMPEGIADIVENLKSAIMDSIDHIDENELADLMTRIAEVVGSFGAGRVVTGTIALMGLLKAYRAAVKD